VLPLQYLCVSLIICRCSYSTVNTLYIPTRRMEL